MDTVVDGMIAHMKTQIKNPALLNSRFRFNEILFLDVNFHQLNLTRGSSYLPLPEWLVKKKALVNPQNNDEECFKWPMIAALKWADFKFHSERVSNLIKFTDNYNWSGLAFPASTKEIEKFEIGNNVSVNVLAIEDRDIYIWRKSSRKRDNEIDLMLISEEDRWHYIVLKSLSNRIEKR